jgi:ubiquitin-activating enzyme E1
MLLYVFLGKSRASVSAPKLAELNPYTRVSVLEGSSLTIEALEPFSVIVLIDVPLSSQVEIAEYCHSVDKAVIIGDTRGVFGTIFCDFG